MKKAFSLIDLDCANCAMKMEEAIKNIKGVEKVSVNFFTQRMVLSADDEKFDAIVDECVRVCKKIEPDCQIVR